LLEKTRGAEVAAEATESLAEIHLNIIEEMSVSNGHLLAFQQ